MSTEEMAHPIEEALARVLLVQARPESQQRSRDRILLAARERRVPRRRGVRRGLLVLAATLMLSGSAFAAALPMAAGSLPGDLLYPVKLAGESLRLTFARGAEADVRLHLEFSQTRIDEMGRALESGRPDALTDLSGRYSSHIDDAFDLARNERDLLALIHDALERHGSVLASLLADAPPEARDALTTSIEASGRADAAVTSAMDRAEGSESEPGGGAAGGEGGSPAPPPSAAPTSEAPQPGTAPTEAPPDDSVPAPTSAPTGEPSSTPSTAPTSVPSAQPTATPSSQP